MTKKNQGGRPTVMTESTINKLEQGFMLGLTDREACLYADISHQTLYDYCKKYPEFTDRKEMLKEQPKMRAKMNIANDIDKGDISTSKWYLERKAKNEFSATQGIEHSGHIDTSGHLEEIQAYIAELMREEEESADAGSDSRE